MQDEHGNYKVVALGIGSGLAVVGWLALRDAETDEMRGLREGSLRELKVALASAVAADEASGKLPRAGTVLRNLADARKLGMRADEDTVAKARSLLKRAAEAELRSSVNKTVSSLAALQGHREATCSPDATATSTTTAGNCSSTDSGQLQLSPPPQQPDPTQTADSNEQLEGNAYALYRDGDQLREALGLACVADHLYSPSRIQRLRARVGGCLRRCLGRGGEVRTGAGGKFAVEAALVEEARRVLKEVDTRRSGKRGVLKILRLAVPSMPGYLVSLGLGVVQFQCDHQVMSLLPGMSEAVREGGVPALNACVASLVSYFATARVLSLLSTTLSGRSAGWFRVSLHRLLVEACVKQDMSFFDKQPASLSALLSDQVELVKEGIFDTPFELVTSSVKAWTCARAIAQASPRLFYPCLVPLPFAALVVMAQMILVGGYQPPPQSVDILREIRTVREHVMEDEEATNQGIRAVEQNRIEQRDTFFQHCVLNVVTAVITSQVVGLYYYGCKMFSRGELAHSDMQGLALSALTLMSTVPGLLQNVSQTFDLYSRVARLAAILDAQPLIEQPHTANASYLLQAGDDTEAGTDGAETQLQELSGLIELESVGFSYPAAAEGAGRALADVSFKVPPGQQTAVVGAIGCGKSTIVKLIERLYDSDTGSIKIDGRAIKEYNLTKLRRAMAIVAQEPVLLGQTIKEAIVYGLTPPPADEVVKAACVDANAWEFIDALRDGLHAPIHGAGAQLSVGQKQCIAIARAMIRNPTILLLDEATSSLDGMSEKMVQDGIDRLRKGSAKTTLIIAHRLQTVMSCDNIVVLEKGRVVEQGTHAELLMAAVEKGDAGYQSGLYRTMWESQMKSGEEDEAAVLRKQVHSLQSENTALQAELTAAQEQAARHSGGGSLSFLGR